MNAEDYYKFHFPYPSLVHLLRVPEAERPDQSQPVDSDVLSRRELAFGYKITRKGKVETPFQRYKTFPGTEEMTPVAQLSRKFVLSRPTRIDIGPVYSLPAKWMRRCEAPVQYRELIFDLDLSPAYDELRCCECIQPAAVQHLCARCWPFVTAAMHCMDYLLYEVFGFRDVMWVFSGRRGVHCWVLDSTAAAMSPEARAAIAAFFHQLETAHLSQPGRPLFCAERPYLEHLYTSILLPRFLLLIAQQAVRLDSAAARSYMADAFASCSDPLALRILLDRLTADSAETWSALSALAQQFHCEHILPKVVFAVLFPKLDLGVTRSPNHLIRCPLSIHPETMNVCIPLPLDEVDSLDPSKFPCLHKSPTLQNLGYWTGEFSDQLLCRHPFASFLTCSVCVREVADLAALSFELLFYDEVAAWREHCAVQHPQCHDSPADCTLAALINRRTATLSGPERRVEKLRLYRTLSKRLE